ncbi:MAG TPA: hypothetical protein VG992_00100 [Candidatus Saccharimonadales bacterium]|nr:hypothetical protein [Candidatus Saccharimonadales bacterium]
MQTGIYQRREQYIRQIDEAHDRWYKKLIGAVAVGVGFAFLVAGSSTDQNNPRRADAELTLLLDEAFLAAGALTFAGSAASQSYALVATRRNQRHEQEVINHLAAEPELVALAASLAVLDSLYPED